VLRDKDAIATVAVKDVAVARKFYEQTLGLTLIHSQQGAAFTYRSGSSKLLVYQSQYAGTNRATAVTWAVGPAVEEIVRSLKSKGVAFEHYELPGGELQGDVHVAGDFKVAWFKDPDGNIHSLVSG